MQLFPVATQIFETASNVLSTAGEVSGFQDVFSSFIEEGRYDYTGRPAGFASQGTLSGTISENVSSYLSQGLRERNVSTETIEKLETMLASGSPATIGTIFGALSGKGRYTEKLSDEDAANFKAILGKLGFSKEEQDDLIALSDEGDTSALYERIAAKIDKLEGTLELTKSDWAALLKGLDASKNLANGLMAFFAGGEDLSLSKEDLTTMLGGYRAALSQREAATAHAKEEMREAMVEALAAAKVKKQSEPVADSRGSRRSEQSESLMQNSVRKNTGVDDLKKEGFERPESDPRGEAEANAADDFEARKDGKSRSERILSTSGQPEPARTKTAEKAADAPKPTAIPNLTASPEVQAAPQARQSANTATLAQNNRQEIFAQVEQGLLQSALNGGQRLTLQLNPGELGQVTVILSVHQGEVKATIRAENADSADALRAQLADLRTSLEAEGLKVKELDVQTGLSEQSLADRWDSHKEHNLMRDASERDRMLRLTRIRRGAADVSGGREQLEHASTGSGEAGLHVVA